jgi:hypothetical protein
MGAKQQNIIFSLVDETKSTCCGKPFGEIYRNMKIHALRQLGQDCSLITLDQDTDSFLFKCQSISNWWNNMSGKVFVATFCRFLTNHGIIWDLERKRDLVSTGIIDVVINPGRQNEFYVELKYSLRERYKQLLNDYLKTRRCFLVTSGTDLSQATLDKLYTHGFGVVTTENTRGRTVEDFIRILKER